VSLKNSEVGTAGENTEPRAMGIPPRSTNAFVQNDREGRWTSTAVVRTEHHETRRTRPVAVGGKVYPMPVNGSSSPSSPALCAAETCIREM
jgi:hypothetical protein